MYLEILEKDWKEKFAEWDKQFKGENIPSKKGQSRNKRIQEAVFL